MAEVDDHNPVVIIRRWLKYENQTLHAQRRPWLWFIYCITVPLDTASMYVLSTLMV